MVEVEAKAMASRLEGSRAEVEAKAMASRFEGSRAESKGKGKGKGKSKDLTWAEYRAMEKQLHSVLEKMSDLSWKLNLERIRGCFGDRLVEVVFPSGETTLRQPEALTVMEQCLLLVSEFEKRSDPPYFSSISDRPAADPKRLRKEEEDVEEKAAEEAAASQKSKHKPRHIQDMEELWKRLMS